MQSICLFIAFDVTIFSLRNHIRSLWRCMVYMIVQIWLRDFFMKLNFYTNNIKWIWIYNVFYFVFQTSKLHIFPILDWSSQLYWSKLCPDRSQGAPGQVYPTIQHAARYGPIIWYCRNNNDSSERWDQMYTDC